MSIVTFSFPTTTLFGSGALSELPDRLRRLGIRRPLVVTDPGLLSTEAWRALAAVLDPARQNLDWHLYAAVHANPLESDVREPASSTPNSSPGSSSWTRS